MEQIKGETVFRQQTAQENAEIAVTKVTRAKADIFDGKVPAGQLPTPTPILFDELVNVIAPENGIVNLTTHNYKTIILDISALDSNPQLVLTLPKYCVVKFTNAGETDGNVSLNVGTIYNGTPLIILPQNYVVEGAVVSAGAVSFNLSWENVMILKMNYYMQVQMQNEV